jgi:hypothetical protein
LKHKQTKEALDIIKKFTNLCKEDRDFEDEFMIFFENLIVDYRSSNITAQEVDKQLSDYLDSYIKNKRQIKIDSIIGKKE